MSKQFEELIKKAMWVLIILFVIRCLISASDIIKPFSFDSVYSIFGYAGEAIGVTAIIVAIYNNWGWKYDPTIQRPVLKKKYSGTINSSYNSQTYDAKLEIKQSFLKISVILKTQESTSKSLIASIDDVFGERLLTYTYLNTPMASVRERSAIHYGTAMLSVDNPLEITGTYFTDRKSTGDVQFIPE